MRKPERSLEPDDLLHTQDLLRRGIVPWEDARRSTSRLHRVRRGSYVEESRWAELGDENRFRALVVCTYESMRTRPTPPACLHAAAVLWELPILGRWPSHVDVVTDSSASGSSRLIRRHRVAAIPEPVEVRGIPATSVARTVIDLARIGDLASGLVTADAALHSHKCTLEELDAEVDAIPRGASGRRRAALAIRLADGRSESPGESLSRARIFEFGFAQPDLQVPLIDNRGRFGYSDFGWGSQRGGFDGEMKYDDPTALWREKQREDRARRVGQTAIRWVWKDALRGDEMRTVLSAAAVPRSRTPWRRWDPTLQPIRTDTNFR
jgi:hypothetical protein